MPTDLTPDDRARYELMRKGLAARGFEDVAEAGGLRVGTRIRHQGHQWPGAGVKGTGVVAALTQYPHETAWSRRAGRLEVELIAVWDRTSFGTRLSQLGDYHVQIADNQPKRPAP